MKLLEKDKIYARGRVWLHLYTACAEDELATEQVFSDLLKGQVPEIRGAEFRVLHQLKNKMVKG